MKKSTDRSCPSAAAPVAFVTDDPAAALAHFADEAEVVAPDDAPTFTGDLDVARHNIDRTLTYVGPHRAAVAAVGTVSLAEVDELPTLWLAARTAASAVAKPTPSDRAVNDAISWAAPRRAAALSYLDAAVFVELVPAGEVRAIRAGKGAIDIANDCVAIYGLFQRHGESLDGKHPFSDEWLGELLERGRWLQQKLKPTDAVTAPTERRADALLRDRLAVMLSRRYDALRAALGTVVGLRELDRVAPKLYSARRPKRAKTATPAKV